MGNIDLSLSRRKRERRKLIINMLYIAPALIFLLGVVIIPFLQAIPYSFTNWRSLLSDKREWVGFSNYATLIKNERFLITVRNTFAYTVPYIIITNVIGLGLALLVKRGNTFNNFGRTIFFLPFTVSTVASAIVWNYVFVDIYSAITGNISPFGLSNQVIAGMVVVGTWRDMGYCMLIFIAGLLAIPDDYYEAAMIEGAGVFYRFIHITLPLIVPAFTSNVTLLLAWGLKLFDLPMAIARNMQAAETVTMFVYDNIFSYSRAGFGQAAAILFTIVLLILTRVITWLFRRKEVEL